MRIAPPTGVVVCCLLVLGCFEVPPRLARTQYEQGAGDGFDVGQPTDVPAPIDPGGVPDVWVDAAGPIADGLGDADEDVPAVPDADAGTDPMDVDDVAQDPDAPEPPPDTGDAGDADPDACTADCDGKECGGDGCGGLCGICLFGEVCNAAQQCGPPCDPVCAGKLCGSDGCGGSCGDCPEGFECGPDFKCYDVVCEGSCDGKVCGDDGCGASCGECVDGDLCEEGQCVAGPCSGIPEYGKCEAGQAVLCIGGAKFVKDCTLLEGMVCGWNPDDGLYGCVEEAECIPDCAGKECGDDGCEGKCGSCPEGWPCEVGTCKLKDGAACGYVTGVGICEGQVLWYCSEGKLYTMDCSIPAKTCGFDPGAGANQCLD